MNLRHAAALSLMAWYLIIPPARNGIVPPVSEWRHAGVFENADDCATARNLVVDACRQDRGIVSSEDEESGRLGCIMTIALSQCIASDDPRLEK
jgi:hypothetical protein